MATNFDELKWFKESLQKQLKPCPFCGSAKDVVIHAPNKDNKEDVECLRCGVKMTRALGVGVVASWNDRV